MADLQQNSGAILGNQITPPAAGGTDPTKDLDYWIHSPDNPYGNKKGENAKLGLSNDLNQQAWAAYQTIFGRAPTQDELAQASQAFSSGDPHRSNLQQGMAYVSQAHQATDNTPDKLYAKQQAQYLADAPKHADEINQLFQSTYGRAASQDELNHFGSALASGTQDKYQLQQFLQQQPEYQNKQNASMRANLSTELASGDQKYFQSNILPSIQQAYAKQGRSFDSSGFQSAATQSAQGQNNARAQYIAQLGAQQYGTTQENAYNDYANQVSQQQHLTNAGTSALYSQSQGVLNRANELGDFNTQSQLYNQYLAKYGKRGMSPAQGAISGGATGASTGAAFGPYGALIGGIAGAGLGAYGASSGGNY